MGADQAALPAGAATGPRALCAAQPTEFVRPCWCRAFVDDRPEGNVVDSAGAFGREGCPSLEPADARRTCLAGARALESALVTFS